MMQPNQQPTRRGFLDYLIALCSTIAGLAMTIPGMMYLWPAAKGSGSENVEVEGASSMSIGQAKTIQVGGKAVIIVRERDQFKAFSAICTHLGCLVRWNESGKNFLCPCHAAVFDKNGKVVSGPPPAALPVYNVKEVGEKIYVSAT